MNTLELEGIFQYGEFQVFCSHVREYLKSKKYRKWDMVDGNIRYHLKKMKKGDTNAHFVTEAIGKVLDVYLKERAKKDEEANILQIINRKAS